MGEMNKRRSKVLKLNVEKPSDSPSKAQGGTEKCDHSCPHHEEEVVAPKKKLSRVSSGVFGVESGIIGEVLEERLQSRI